MPLKVQARTKEGENMNGQCLIYVFDKNFDKDWQRENSKKSRGPTNRNRTNKEKITKKMKTARQMDNSKLTCNEHSLRSPSTHTDIDRYPLSELTFTLHSLRRPSTNFQFVCFWSRLESTGCWTVPFLAWLMYCCDGGKKNTTQWHHVD